MQNCHKQHNSVSDVAGIICREGTYIITVGIRKVDHEFLREENLFLFSARVWKYNQTPN